MGCFIKVADTSDETKGCLFINLDQVTSIDCFVKQTGGGVNIQNIGPGKTQTSTPVRTMAIIELTTASRNGILSFSDFAEAEKWLRENVAIEFSFSQLS